MPSLSTCNMQDLDQVEMETLQVESCVQGHPICKEIWNLIAGEELNCMRESTNSEDPYAVAVMRNSTEIGRAHV